MCKAGAQTDGPAGFPSPITGVSSPTCSEDPKGAHVSSSLLTPIHLSTFLPPPQSQELWLRFTPSQGVGGIFINCTTGLGPRAASANVQMRFCWLW